MEASLPPCRSCPNGGCKSLWPWSLEKIRSETLHDRCPPWCSVPGTSRAGKQSKEKEKRVCTEEKMDCIQKKKRKKKGGKYKQSQAKKSRIRGRKRGVGSWKTEFRHHILQTSSLEWDLLCHVSVSQQRVGSESDTTGLDIFQAVSVTLTELEEKWKTSYELNHN